MSYPVSLLGSRIFELDSSTACRKAPIVGAISAGLILALAGCGNAKVTENGSPGKSASSSAGVVIHVDAAVGRHPISPLVYGANFASQEQARLLNLPINRNGGNAATRYNWQLNATSSGEDWFFLSHGDKDATPGASVDTFVKGNMASGAAGGTKSMVTIPMIGWAAKLGPNRSNLWSFSVAKYGPQQKTEEYNHDMGNGIKPDGTPITGNDPNDANTPVSVDFERGWMNHLVGQFGTSAKGGIAYYLLDNEPGLWQETHRDVFPVGLKMDDLFSRERDTAAMIKSVDPTAQVGGPEAWGWIEYLYSGYDSQWNKQHGYALPRPDRSAHGGADQVPWLLQQFAADQKRSGKRLLDVLTLHYYPQANQVSSADNSEATQLLRNRSTRSLWDPDYTDESWIKEKIRLIPRMKEWVAQYYPGTKIGITEYDFGAEAQMSGAVAEADAVGIFGREGLDLATRWTCPKTGSPVFKAMQLYRNYDGKNGSFGDTSVHCDVPDPDNVSAFASEDQKTGSLKLMLINKQIHNSVAITVALAHVSPGGPAEAYRLDASNEITRLADVHASGANVSISLPAQSITLLVFPPARR